MAITLLTETSLIEYYSNGLSDPFITFNFDGLEFETEIKEKSKEVCVCASYLTRY